MKNRQNKGSQDMVGQRARINAVQRTAVIDLFAIEALLGVMEQHMQHIVRRFQNGWRDFRLVQKMVSKLARSIEETIPAEQLRSIKRQLSMSQIQVVPRSVQPLKSETLVDDEVIAVLAGYAAEGACLMCENPNRRDCDLKEILRDLAIEPLDGRAEIMSPCLRDV